MAVVIPAADKYSQSVEYDFLHESQVSFLRSALIKKKILYILFLFLASNLFAQKENSTFIFGHSLINHEFQINPTPSQETSVPHWLHFLSLEANHIFKVSGQYGFLPQHINLPPIAQWGFDFVEGAWDSDNVPFSEADFNSILITPGNFIQWQAPDMNYPMESISPVSATEAIFDWCNNQEADLKFYIYENWPDMGPYLNNDFPPSDLEWNDYNNYLNSDFHDWFVEYHDQVAEMFPSSCIKLIPVGTLISRLLNQAPYSEIPIDELYEDDAPHGRTTIYFLASLITYMAIFEEKAPYPFEVDMLVNPIIAENYVDIVDAFWNNLIEFDFEDGSSRVFCNEPIISKLGGSVNEFELVLMKPNPVVSDLTIVNNFKSHFIEVIDVTGQIIIEHNSLRTGTSYINTDKLDRGLYFFHGKDESNNTLYVKKFIKT